MGFATIACVVFLAYFLIDVNYFIRAAFTIIYAKSRKKIRIADPSTIYGFVITTDIDFLLTHMNNARFLREMDFARVDHGCRTGFMVETMRRGGLILLSSSYVRYRLPLPVFSRYKIVTDVTYWDEKNVYLTHKVITLRDNIARAVVYSRTTCPKVDVLDIFQKITPGVERPDLETIPLDYQKWMETLELSSQLMKKATIAGGGVCSGKGGGDGKPSKDECTFGSATVDETNSLLTCKLSSEEYSKDNLIHKD